MSQQNRKPSTRKARKSSRDEITIGIDIGDRWSHYCVIDEDANVVEEGRFRTVASSVEKHFEGIPHARIAMEAGTHSIWISQQLQTYGHEVVVANVTELHAIVRNISKSDQVDAEKLARYARLDPRILRPITHRSVEAQQALTIVRARDVLVRMRVVAVNAVRGLVKPCGYRLPPCSTPAFTKRSLEVLPKQLLSILGPLLVQIQSMTEQIKIYDRQILELSRSSYPETKVLETVNGVGNLTAITYVLTINDPHRFKKSRDVGCYLGLRPRRDQSGDHDPQLGITKAGNVYLRKLLTEAANYILGPFGKDSALRRWGQGLAARGGKNARKRAVVAIARKLAVLLHHLWVTQKPYQPFYEQAAA
jgi:transposase